LNVLHFYEAISHALSVIEYQIAKHVLDQADIVLRPLVLSFNWLAFDKAFEIIREGERELRRYLPEIRKRTGYPEPDKTLFDQFIDFLFTEG